MNPAVPVVPRAAPPSVLECPRRTRGESLLDTGREVFALAQTRGREQGRARRKGNEDRYSGRYGHPGSREGFGGVSSENGLLWCESRCSGTVGHNSGGPHIGEAQGRERGLRC